jgi:plastocyanin
MTLSPGFLRILTLLAAAVVLGCGGGEAPPASEQPAAPVANPVDPATAGTIAGRIVFEGTPPAAQPLTMKSDPNCKPSETSVTETVVVGDDGGFQNVFVYVKDGLDDLQFPVPTTPVVMAQENCRYVPHVMGIQVGQPFEVLNSDDTLHNVHAVARTNREFNAGQPLKGIRNTFTFTAQEVMVPFKCDVHNWMNAWVGVLDHPFYAVTGSDGSFEITGVPPGTYTIEAWHEKLGVQTQTVTVGEKSTATAGFTFKG